MQPHLEGQMDTGQAGAHQSCYAVVPGVIGLHVGTSAPKTRGSLAREDGRGRWT